MPDRDGTPPAMSRHLAVLGAGLMGSQIGLDFALRGYAVHFLETDVARAESRIAGTLSRAEELGIASPDAATAARRSIIVTRDVRDLPPQTPLAIECLPENLELKAEVLKKVGGRAPGAVLATNTSSIGIGAIGQGAGMPERVVGAHYWNPPLLMPLVEVTPGPETAPAAVELVCRAVEDAGKTVVRVRRDVPGFIWNRLQMAILREALWLLDNDVATIESIDAVAELGLARRWRQAGLFGSIHLGGGRTWETVAANLFPLLSGATDARGLADRVAAHADIWDGLETRRDEGLARDRLGERVRPGN